MTTKTDEERRALLTSLDLNPDAPGLTEAPEQVETPVQKSKKAKKAKGEPKAKVKGKDKTRKAKPKPERDLHTADPASIDFASIPLPEDIDLLTVDGRREASAYLFAQVRSAHRDTPRHSALHKHISTFISNAVLARRTGGVVTEHIATTAEDRAIAQVIAAKGLTPKQVAAALAAYTS